MKPCKNCQFDWQLHHADTDQCPSYADAGTWRDTTFEPAPLVAPTPPLEADAIQEALLYYANHPDLAPGERGVAVRAIRALRSGSTATGAGEARLVPVTGPGQIRVGDTIVFNAGGEEKIERAVLVLSPGTDREEIIWHKKKNRYFITVNVLDDGKFASPYLTKVRVLRAPSPSGATETKGEA